MSEPVLPANPGAEFSAREAEIRAAIDRVLRSGHYILGPEVDAFEQAWADWLGGGWTVGLANGTDALELALRALGVGTGDLVLTVANTVSATAAAIQQIGARIGFVEIDEATMTMSPAALAEILRQGESKPKVIVPVHLYGRMADMENIMRLALEHGVRVLEDCAQAHGALSNGRKAGTWGDAAAFSFYPTKNLGALGDAGAVFSRDAAVANRVKTLRQYGWARRYVSDEPGRNSRLDEIQAAVLRVKLQHLETDNERRRQWAARYLSLLQGKSLTLPVADGNGDVSAWHQFTVRVPGRDDVQSALAKSGVHCGILYPVPLHRQPAYAQDIKLPITEAACAQVLCLPVHPRLTAADIDRVAAELIRCLQV